MTTPAATPTIAALAGHGWRLASAPLLTGAALAMACTPAGCWGCAIVRDRTPAGWDAAFLAAALQAAERAGDTPPWLAALARPALPPPAPWAVFDLDVRLASLEQRAAAAGLADARVAFLARQLAAEFEV